MGEFRSLCLFDQRVNGVEHRVIGCTVVGQFQQIRAWGEIVAVPSEQSVVALHLIAYGDRVAGPFEAFDCGFQVFPIGINGRAAVGFDAVSGIATQLAEGDFQLARGTLLVDRTRGFGIKVPADAFGTYFTGNGLAGGLVYAEEGQNGIGLGTFVNLADIGIAAFLAKGVFALGQNVFGSFVQADVFAVFGFGLLGGTLVMAVEGVIQAGLI